MSEPDLLAEAIEHLVDQAHGIKEHPSDAAATTVNVGDLRRVLRALNEAQGLSIETPGRVESALRFEALMVQCAERRREEANPARGRLYASEMPIYPREVMAMLEKAKRTDG